MLQKEELTMADGILAIAGDPIQDIYITTNKNYLIMGIGGKVF